MNIGIALYKPVAYFIMETNYVQGEAATEFHNIIYNKPRRCNSGSIVFINNYEYALHVSDALCIHLQEHYKL